jgi:methionyl-tRNA formyltransferase
MLAKADGAIDFARPAAEIAARIRGVDPWPGAHAVLRGEVVKLFRARPGDGPNGPGAGPDGPRAGLVVAIDAHGAHVVAGDGRVAIIRELQAPGRKRVAAAQFAAGRGIAVGDVLGKPELA